MFVIVNKYITHLFSLGMADGIMIFPFAFFVHQRLANNVIVVNHERIHFYQSLELLVLPFYLIYVIEFLIKILKYKNIEKAYFNISFEREAYQNENDLDYLKRRKSFSFFKYF